MERLNSAIVSKKDRPVKVLQFGEGNFLRAFVDYMIDILNEKTGFDGGIVLVKPIPSGSLDNFRDQDDLYTVILRGLLNGTPYEETRVISSVQDAVCAYEDYDRYAEYAKLDTLKYIVSNTTEAGIVLDSTDRFDACPPVSFPGKLTKFLYERARHYDYASDKGLVMLPVELIDDNGIMLKKCVTELAHIWNLGDRFLHWLDDACTFTSTLVDRIVTGYPRNEDHALWNKIGYEDHLLVTAEPFGLWVIESSKDISDELDFPSCGLPVIYTDNQKPYKQRKVRILNGAHTSFVPAAYLSGHNYVLEAMNDPLFATFIQHTVYDEVIPTLLLPVNDLTDFAEAVKSRFSNPYIKHALLSICLNCISKWRARCLPSLLDYYRKFSSLPPHLTFSLAAMLSLYRGGILKSDGLHCLRNDEEYVLQDDIAVMEFFNTHRDDSAEKLVKDFISDDRFAGSELCHIDGLTERVAGFVKEIEQNGMKAVIADHFGGEK